MSETYVTIRNEFGNECKCELGYLDYKLRQGAEILSEGDKAIYEKYIAEKNPEITDAEFTAKAKPAKAK
jgi:hypothetical protein